LIRSPDVSRLSILARFLGATATALSAACMMATRPHTIPWDQIPPSEQRDRLVSDAQDLIDRSSFDVGTRTFPADCSGYVAAVLFRSGIDVYRGATELQIRGNGVRLLHHHLLRYGTLFDREEPRPGDLVFFSNTYDANRDRKPNDPLTHVGIVERIEGDGTIVFLHQLRGRVRRDFMNLKQAERHKSDAGETLNSHLRRRDRRGTATLASKLFAGFGSIVRRW
jgi:hypothetical protein